jgi:hypothetical protein
MNKVELIHYSLSFAFEVLESLVGDLTQEQADWLPPGNANPIGALYWHTIAYVDQYTHDFCMAPFSQIPFEAWWEAKCAQRELNSGQMPLRHTAGWQEKVIVTLPPRNPDDPYWEVRATREGLKLDLPALHGYAKDTAQTLLSWVAGLTPEDLERTISTPIGNLSQGQVLESFIVGHINNHSGEISALRGCLSLKGYPW